ALRTPRPLALEVQVAAQDGGERIARATAQVLGPAVAAVAGCPEAIARVAADEVAAHVAGGQLLGIRPGDLAADPAVELECGDVPAAGAGARAAGADDATGARAVHEVQVVALDGRPAARPDGTATAAPTAAATAATGAPAG